MCRACRMLQGENVPGSVLILQDVIQDLDEDGEDASWQRLGSADFAGSVSVRVEHEQQVLPEVFHFYILFLLGFMCGLAGGSGSRLPGCSCLSCGCLLPCCIEAWTSHTSPDFRNGHVNMGAHKVPRQQERRRSPGGFHHKLAVAEWVWLI